jgi:hypothetical protein
MTPFRKLLIAGSSVLLLGGCMHHNSTTLAAGDVAIDSLTATRTAILRIENNYTSEVRVYTVMHGQKNYIAKAMPGEVRSWVMDPKLFPNPSISFETSAKDGTNSRVLGPYRLDKGETIDIVVPANFDRIHASIHRSGV